MTVSLGEYTRCSILGIFSGSIGTDGPKRKESAMQYRLEDLKSLKDADGRACPSDVIDLLVQASVTNLSFKGKPNWEVTRTDAESLLARMGRTVASKD